MGFLSNAGTTFKTLLSPSKAPGLMQSGVEDIFRPIKELKTLGLPKSLGDAAARLPALGFTSLLGLPFLYEAIKPNQPDLDQSGPFEDLTRRAFNLYMAAAPMAPGLWHGKGMAAPLAGMIGAGIAGNVGSKYTGRLADTALGMRPTPDELMERFTNRIQPRMEEISQEYKVPPDQAQQYAIQELLQQSPDYLDFLTNK